MLLILICLFLKWFTFSRWIFWSSIFSFASVAFFSQSSTWAQAIIFSKFAFCSWTSLIASYHSFRVRHFLTSHCNPSRLLRKYELFYLFEATINYWNFLPVIFLSYKICSVITLLQPEKTHDSLYPSEWLVQTAWTSVWGHCYVKNSLQSLGSIYTLGCPLVSSSLSKYGLIHFVC